MHGKHCNHVNFLYEELKHTKNSKIKLISYPKLKVKFTPSLVPKSFSMNSTQVHSPFKNSKKTTDTIDSITKDLNRQISDIKNEKKFEIVKQSLISYSKILNNSKERNYILTIVEILSGMFTSTNTNEVVSTDSFDELELIQFSDRIKMKKHNSMPNIKKLDFNFNKNTRNYKQKPKPKLKTSFSISSSMKNIFSYKNL